MPPAFLSRPREGKPPTGAGVLHSLSEMTDPVKWGTEALTPRQVDSGKTAKSRYLGTVEHWRVLASCGGAALAKACLRLAGNGILGRVAKSRTNTPPKPRECAECGIIALLVWYD